MQQLVDDYYFREMNSAEFEPLFMQHQATVFGETLTFDRRGAISAEEWARLQQLDAPFQGREQIRIGIFNAQHKFVGWHTGEQHPFGKFYMANSAMLPEYQQKGLYTALLPHIIEIVRKRGYQLIYSRHAATNNAVLVPKLKAGFQITSFEIDTRWGLLVHLTYFFNPLQRKALAFRTGESIPDAALLPYLNLGRENEIA